MESRKLNILIVAYFFAPDKRVGALRTSYWYNELPKVLNCSVSVITANPDAKGENVFIVPANKKASRLNPIKDDGLAWRSEVRSFLKQNQLIPPDVVIISGSPFMHFSLTGDFQKRFNSKVILDYRDPFAINPGFNNSKIKSLVKNYFETGFNKQADSILTVNEFCAKLITGFYEKPHAIVQNGFDETVKPVLKEVNVVQPVLSYTGKFYFDPSPLLNALEKLNLKIVYAGPENHLIKDSHYSESRGFVDYPTSVQIIGDSDIAVIQTYGEDFQSTTKLFDYIRCKRIILIVSNKHLHRGSLHEELKEYPNVYWCANNEQAIIDILKEIKSSTYVEVSEEVINRYSRKVQMLKLVNLIKQLCK